MAWWEFGEVSAKKTVLYCHGTPGSGVDAQLFTASAQDLGLRIIAIDRPGYGHSDREPGRNVASWAHDAQAVLDHLGIEKVAVVGYSGGCPHALALLQEMPERISSLGLAAPFIPRKGFAGWVERVSAPWRMFVAWALNSLGSRVAHRSTRVRNLLTDAQAFRQGICGAIDDERAIINNWGIEPGALRIALATHQIPVTVWIGGRDRVIAPKESRQVAHLLGAKIILHPHSTHSTLLFSLSLSSKV